MKLLINVDDIAIYRPLSKEIPIERITPYILEAQRIDLKDVLGPTVYYDFLEKFDSSLDPMYTKYQELLKGKVYNNSAGQPQYFDGLIPCLVYYSLARFYENNQINASKFGLVTKVDENSSPVTPEVLRQAIASLKSSAIKYQEEAKTFLEIRIADYPLYSSSVKGDLNKTSVKFF